MGSCLGQICGMQLLCDEACGVIPLAADRVTGIRPFASFTDSHSNNNNIRNILVQFPVI